MAYDAPNYYGTNLKRVPLVCNVLCVSNFVFFTNSFLSIKISLDLISNR